MNKYVERFISFHLSSSVIESPGVHEGHHDDDDDDNDDDDDDDGDGDADADADIHDDDRDHFAFS